MSKLEPREPSYKKVNYLLRLRKQVERKIIIEILQKLSHHEDINISRYCYFGLGSIYFADFILFHKYLHIKDMISIDKAEDEKGRDEEQRFKFNKPYAFLKFEKNISTDFMKKGRLDWNKDLLIWLDYDSKLTIANKFIINDLKIVAANAKSYHIFITTIECEFGEPGEKLGLVLDEEIKKFLPPRMKVTDLDPEIAPKVLNHFVKECLNAGLGNNPQRAYIPLFNFNYKDTANMYTFGCIFLDKKAVPEFRDFCERNEIDIAEEPKRIDCPIITPKEKYHLDSCIAYRGNQIQCRWAKARKTGLAKEDVERYMNDSYYKHYPQFFESIY